MAPEKFFDYLEGKLPADEREGLERALIADPELQKEFVAARQIHRTLERSPEESAALARAGSRGRHLAAAFAVLVALNVGIGLYFIFRSAGPPPEMHRAQLEAMRQQVERSVKQAAAANFSPPRIAAPPIVLTIPAEKQEAVAKAIISAAEQAGGSGTKELPDEKGERIFVLVPAAREPEFRQSLSAFGASPSPAEAAASPSPASPNEPVHLEIVLSRPLRDGQ